MSDEYLAAIEGLKKVLAGFEKKVVDTKTMINNLSVLSGRSEIYTDLESSSESNITAIQSDTFYGKSVITASREYLEMRRASNMGPASIKDIFESLRKGGFIFNSKSDHNSQIVIRNALSKASSVFHKLPTGDYGLTKWYDLGKIRKVKSSIVEVETADPGDEPADD